MVLTTASRCWPELRMISAYSRRFTGSMRRELLARQHFREADDRVERRAQLMADIGEEARLAGGRHLALALRRLYRLGGVTLRRHIAQNADDAGRARVLGLLHQAAARLEEVEHRLDELAELVARMADAQPQRRRVGSRVAMASETSLRKAGRSATWTRWNKPRPINSRASSP